MVVTGLSKARQHPEKWGFSLELDPSDKAPLRPPCRPREAMDAEAVQYKPRREMVQPTTSKGRNHTSAPPSVARDASLSVDTLVAKSLPAPVVQDKPSPVAPLSAEVIAQMQPAQIMAYMEAMIRMTGDNTNEHSSRTAEQPAASSSISPTFRNITAVSSLPPSVSASTSKEAVRDAHNKRKLEEAANVDAVNELREQLVQRKLKAKETSAARAENKKATAGATKSSSVATQRAATRKPSAGASHTATKGKGKQLAKKGKAPIRSSPRRNAGKRSDANRECACRYQTV